MTNSKKLALVTGAKRGLGFAVAEALSRQGYNLILVGRGQKEIDAAAKNIKNPGGTVWAFDADIAVDADVAKLKKWVEEKTDRLDVLVNNAGVFKESMSGASVFDIDPKLVADVFNTNTLGAMRVTVAMAPLLKKSGVANVVNVSSGMGQLSEMNAGFPAYRLSKTAMNALTRIFSQEFGDSVRVNSVCPGWVRTEMGGAQAERTVEEGISGIVWAATLDAKGPTGGFFRDGERIDW